MNPENLDNEQSFVHIDAQPHGLISVRGRRIGAALTSATLSIGLLMGASGGCEPPAPPDCSPDITDVGEAPEPMYLPEPGASTVPYVAPTTTALLDPINYTGKTGCPKVAVIGDSLAALGADYFRQAFSDDYEFELKAKGGQRMDQLFTALDMLLETEPKVVVVSAFTNNMLQHSTYDATFPDAELLLQKTADVPCVIIFDLWRTTEQNHGGSIGTQFNAWLEEATQRYPNVHRVYWDEQVTNPDGSADLANWPLWGAWFPEWNAPIGDMVHFPAPGSHKRAMDALEIAIGDSSCR